jgi:hypothetical protein
MDHTLAGYAAGSSTAGWEFDKGMFAFGKPSPRAGLAETLKYHLCDGIAEAISCPTLVRDAEGDHFFKGRPKAL